MKLQFKTQGYQTQAVDSVADCFAGQLFDDAATRYRIDPGTVKSGQQHQGLRMKISILI